MPAWLRHSSGGRGPGSRRPYIDANLPALEPRFRERPVCLNNAIAWRIEAKHLGTVPPESVVATAPGREVIRQHRHVGRRVHAWFEDLEAIGAHFASNGFV